MLSVILSTLFVSTSPIKPIVTPKPRLAVQTQSAASLYRRVKPYVVTVKTSGGTGSGFITDEGLLYTAYHVVRGASKLTAVTGTGKSIPLKTVIAADTEQDWICFQTSIKGSIHVAKHNNSPVGARVTLIGSPKGLAHTINEGLMSGRRALGKADRIQLSIPTSPGSSGSPVFNASGDVIGIVTGGPDEQTESITYAVPASRFVSRRGIPADLVSRDYSDAENGAYIHSVYDEIVDKSVNEAKRLKIEDDDDARGLIVMSSTNVEVTGNDLFKEIMQLDPLKESLTSALKSACPRLEIVDDVEQEKKRDYWLKEYEVEDEVDGLVSRLWANDDWTRKLFVSVELEKRNDSYIVSTYFVMRRGSLSYIGEKYWDAYSDFKSETISNKDSLASATKETIKTMVTKFAEKWNLANPEEKEDKDKK